MMSSFFCLACNSDFLTTILFFCFFFLVQRLCQLYQLSAENIVEEWVAFCSTKKQNSKRIDIDTLEHLEREVGVIFKFSNHQRRNMLYLQ
jgi:hypothetical protein